ncbi:MAG: GFA family protein [Geminicoccaceae bacterium]
MAKVHRGSCLCGAVSFEISGDLPQPVACHGTNCRKFTGHFEVSIDVPDARLSVRGDESVKWFQPSEKTRRRFCCRCGSSSFFDPIHHDWIGISMGAFDCPTGTTVAMHIYVADKGDYYQIADGLPQKRQQ